MQTRALAKIFLHLTHSTYLDPTPLAPRNASMRVGHLESARQVFNDRLLGESWERDHVVASVPAGPGEVIFDVTVLAASEDAGGEIHQTSTKSADSCRRLLTTNSINSINSKPGTD